MAKMKPMSMPMSPPSASATVEKVEGGFVVRTTMEGGKKGYRTKNHVAKTREDAARIVQRHFGDLHRAIMRT